MIELSDHQTVADKLLFDGWKYWLSYFLKMKRYKYQITIFVLQIKINLQPILIIENTYHSVFFLPLPLK